MNIIIIPDSFKGTLSAVRVADIAQEEIKKIIAKKRAKYDDEKLISYLCRQGFSFELAQSLVRETD